MHSWRALRQDFPDSQNRWRPNRPLTAPSHDEHSVISSVGGQAPENRPLAVDRRTLCFRRRHLRSSTYHRPSGETSCIPVSRSFEALGRRRLRYRFRSHGNLHDLVTTCISTFDAPVPAFSAARHSSVTSAHKPPREISFAVPSETKQIRKRPPGEAEFLMKAGSASLGIILPSIVRNGYPPPPFCNITTSRPKGTRSPTKKVRTSGLPFG